MIKVSISSLPPFFFHKFRYLVLRFLYCAYQSKQLWNPLLFGWSTFGESDWSPHLWFTWKGKAHKTFDIFGTSKTFSANSVFSFSRHCIVHSADDIESLNLYIFILKYFSFTNTDQSNFSGKQYLYYLLRTAKSSRNALHFSSAKAKTKIPWHYGSKLHEI